ncbi:MAG: rhodanese-related sulfurtransferase [Candidatus Marinimicrobia bacterium]|jgi:UPF0176 protein|nr:rhodanese-related sulfurtransferase [Candidatus Neomarinimicrobiota bacterium]
MKKKLYNQKDRPHLKAELAAENFTRMTCSFYRYVNIDNPNALRDELYKEWIELNVLGRVYIAEEGINAQISIPAPEFDTFIRLLNKRIYLVDMPIKHAIEEGQSFIKLAIRVKKEIVAYNVPEDEYNMSKVGTHLNASEFNKALESPDTIVVDMRNYYESEVGHFHDAILPDVERSQELLPEVKKLLQNNEDKEVLLYCTGGIRCEKASSYLLHHGFKDVKQLKGGIIQYAQDIKTESIDSKFIGSNFVFDQRLEERITDDIISKCHQCGNFSDTHTDCLNQACHILFIQCEKCREKFDGCCSLECQDFAALPLEEQRILRKDPNKVVSKTRNSVSGKPRL